MSSPIEYPNNKIIKVLPSAGHGKQLTSTHYCNKPQMKQLVRTAPKEEHQKCLDNAHLEVSKTGHQAKMLEKYIEDISSLKKYYEETDAHVNPECLALLKSDIATFHACISRCPSKLESETEHCSAEWLEMVDAVNREQGYY